MVYRRGPDAMGASDEEQRWAKTQGVVLHHWMAPVAIEGDALGARAVRFERQRLQDGRLVGCGEFETLAADMVLQAVGQRLAHQAWMDSGLEIRHGRIAVNASGQTSLPGVWAGGDCTGGGRDLTVEAVQDGKQAALAIHAHLTSLTALKTRA